MHTVNTVGKLDKISNGAVKSNIIFFLDTANYHL